MKRLAAVSIRDEEFDWVGTPQHPGAGDLSRFLIHLTRTEADLASIVTQGVIEARGAYGVAKSNRLRSACQRAVCFTEMPLAELKRMVPRGRQYGIVFSKEELRAREGAQPVWYLSDPSPQYAAIQSLMNASDSSDDPIWRLTPFVEGVRDLGGGRPNDWRWEREWRMVGNFRFDINQVAAVLVPAPTGDFEPIRDITFGGLYVTPDGDYFWTDSFVDATDGAMELLLDRFHSNWTTPDDALLPLDREAEWGYAELVEIYDSEDAVYQEFEEFPFEVQEALARALTNEGGLWCRVSDVHNLRDDSDL